jgi:hypothetical protein
MFSKCSSSLQVTETKLWTALMEFTAALISSDPSGEDGGGDVDLERGVRKAGKRGGNSKEG